MLKAAGTDRFTIPKLLVELEPDRIENFRQIYQHHSSVMMRHVKQARFLERFTYQRHWSEALEEELICQLPWPEERLRELSTNAPGKDLPLQGVLAGGEDRKIAKFIFENTPFGKLRSLAALVRLRLDDWSAYRDAVSVFSTGAGDVREEAALVLASWRVIYGVRELEIRYPLIEALRASPFHLRASVRLALLGDKETQIPREVIWTDDPDISFTAALVIRDRDRLTSATREGDPLQRFAAALGLVDLDLARILGSVIASATSEQQTEILGRIARRKKGVPELHDTLFDIAEATESRDTRRAVAQVLCLQLSAGQAMRLARCAQKDSTIYQSILLSKSIAPETLQEFCEFLLDEGAFSMEQYGLRDAAKKDRVPADFVPAHWNIACDDQRKQMCRFAEEQLNEYSDEELHRFLAGVAIGGDVVSVIADAWSCLFRWYARIGCSQTPPLSIEMKSLQALFGSVERFVDLFTKFLKRDAIVEILSELAVYDRMSRLLRYADDNVLPSLAAHPRATRELVETIAAIMRNTEISFTLRLDCINFLAHAGKIPELQKEIRTLFQSFRGTDLQHAALSAIVG
jgi:hypothetical protein